MLGPEEAKKWMYGSDKASHHIAAPSASEASKLKISKNERFEQINRGDADIRSL